MSCTHKLAAVAALLLTVPLSARASTMGIQAPVAGYSSRIDGSGSDQVYDSAVDNAGNVYVVGRSRSATMNIDVIRDLDGDDTGRPGLPHTDQLVTNQNGGGFVIKYDRDGNVVWKRFVGSKPSDLITGVTVDGSGNVFVAGTFAGSVTFGGTTLVASSRANSNFNNTLDQPAQQVFVATLDSDGLWQWAKQFEYAVFRSTNTSAVNLGTDVASVPQITTDLPDSTNALRSVRDGYGHTIVRDSDGSLFVKMRVLDTSLAPADNSVYWIRTAGNGKVAVFARIPLGLGSVNLPFDSVFVAKLVAVPPPLGSPANTPTTYDWRWIGAINTGVVYDPTSNVISSIPISGTFGSITGMAVDFNDSIYLTGAWVSKLVAGGSVHDANGGGLVNGYVARLRTTDGSQLYLATFDSNGGGASAGGALILDDQRNVFVTGSESNTSTLRLTSADNTSTTRPMVGAENAGRTAFFVGKISSAGQWLWSEAPSIISDFGFDHAAKLTRVTRDAAGALYLGGALTGRTAGIVFPGGLLVNEYPDPNTGTDAFVAKLTENAGTRTWNWVLQTDGLASNGAAILDVGDLRAGVAGTVYWSVNALPSAAATTRFASQRSPNGADTALDNVQNQGAYLLPINMSAPGLSAQFSITTTVTCGKEVPQPPGIFLLSGHALQPEIILPDGTSGAAHFYWDSFEAKLYAVDPQLAEVRWKTSNSLLDPNRIRQSVVTVWPTPPDLITHVTGAGPNGDEPKVALEPATINNTFNYTFQSILYQTSNAQITGSKLFSSKVDGYSVLLYTVGKNAAAGTAPVSLDVVRTYLWPEAAVFSTNTAQIGREISGVPYSHADPSGKNGYIVNAKARFDGTGAGAAYDRTTQLGTIIPVNEDETTTTDDDMVVIWSNVNPRGVAWPAKAVQYNCKWADPPDGLIFIASSVGSETPDPVEIIPINIFGFGYFKFPVALPQLLLNPATYQGLAVYNQPDKNLAGYNPNEEHALLAPSSAGSGFQAVFALRSDLNNVGNRTTSQPYTLVRYQDATASFKTKFLVLKVLPESFGFIAGPANQFDPPSYASSTPHTFQTFTGTAGTLVQAPYPLPLLPGPATGTTASGTAAFLDRTLRVWAKAQGSITTRYFYPLQPDFWYDINGDGAQDNVTVAPWLDRYAHDKYGGSYNTPIAVNYNIFWPADIPTLAVGDTLTNARDGLPDVESMASATVIYEESNPDLINGALFGSVRFIDYTAERKVPLNATVNGLTLTAGNNGYAVELIASGRYRFRDLPFDLKSRISFDLMNKQLILGGYKDTSGAGVPLILLNVLSSVELNRLANIFAGSGTPLATAFTSLFNLARDPNLVSGGTSGAYYVGIRPNGSGNAPVHADALGPKALTAGKATGLGKVTIVENNAPGLGDSPIALHILEVVNPPVIGEIKVIFSDNSLDEKVTLRHSNDFAAIPDSLFFEWWYKPADGATTPPGPTNPANEGWSLLETPASGHNEVVIEGPGVRTLADMWVFCRYKGYSAGGFNPNTFTNWAGDPTNTPTTPTVQRRPMFVPGWIKRVIDAVGVFEPRVKNFASAPTQTYSSFIQQAGTRYEGAVALNSDASNLNSLGLISFYETIIQRGFSLSLDGTPPQTNDAVNNALLLAATRISDFYMLLGNEAYADAQDPTIGFTSADGEVGNLAPSVFAFANQVPDLISEELALLRGRDNSSAGTSAPPVYNRLFWNFTNGLEGEPVYVQNYGITDQNFDALVNEADARILFPQGHGDAWGHYLSAVKSHYRLLRHPGFTWIPRAETTLVAGVPIQVDYSDEVKFAKASAALANAGAEIVNLTYRDSYVADPSGQWQGYKDSDTTRAWGVDEWARRAGQGAYFNWLTANAILPAVHTEFLPAPTPSPTVGPTPTPAPTPVGPPSGLQKIDRTTVTELSKIAAAYTKVQQQMDQADQGLNPLGVTPGSIPFDIDPAFLIIGSGIQGKKHFEQIYDRTLNALSSARQVFDHANELTQRLRQTQISADQFAQDSLEQEMDYRNRLIEIFGYPYAGDIGSGKTFPTGYNGPDLIHYNYVAVNDVSGNIVAPNTTLTGYFNAFAQQYKTPPGGPASPSDFNQVLQFYFSSDLTDPNASVSASAVLPVAFPLATAATWSFAAPTDWGQRRAPGTLQLAIADIVRAEAELRRGVLAYNNHIAQIKDELDLLQARFNVQTSQINILNNQSNQIIGMNAAIGVLSALSTSTSTAADITEKFVDGIVEAVPKVVGVDNDIFSPIRGLTKIAGAVAFTGLKIAAGVSDIAANSIDLAKEQVGLDTDIQIQKAGFTFEVQEALKSIEALLREEPGLRLDLFNLQEAMRTSIYNYSITLAEGQRLCEERVVYRQKVAGAVTQNRYADMTFRLFRNDALQKYRAAFDLAARYVYLAATTYDYETCQLGTSTSAGRRFLTDIVRERALGQYNDDDPVAGVNGLSDPLGRLNQNYQVLKGRLGINNPQIETGRFSLRNELFRILPDSNEEWREQLQKYRVADLWKVPEFRRFCRPFAPESAGAQPGLVIPFNTTVTFGQNYFGLPLGPGDSSYDSANFVTKINGAGVWFSNYSTQGLATTPRVYLIPVGLDIMRAPDDVNLGTREFDVVDQAIPVPFPVGTSDLNNPNWIPQNDDLDGPMNDIRKFSRFRAYHDDGFEEADLTLDTRLVGRSVWNTKWMIIIPGGTFLSDPNDGLDTFILGKKLPASQTRDGNGVSDIKIFYETYGFSGN